MKRLKDRIERRLNVVFGVFRTPPEARQDFRFIVRLGAGKERRVVNFELGIGGFNVYFGRVGRPI